VSETDSFIEEVTEEVRRDKLFAFFRKYGWIPILVVVLFVAATAWNEWRKASERAAAETFGDSMLTAIAQTAPADQAAALGAIEPGSNDGRVFLDLITAAANAEADDKAKALVLFDQIAADANAPEIYRQLATLKAAILRGSDLAKEARIAVFDKLATPGGIFRPIALEQKALVLYEFGDSTAAIALLRTILDEPGTTQGLLQRAQRLIVAMGGSLSPAGGGSNG